MLFIVLFLDYAIIAYSNLPNTRSLELSEIINMRYQCITADCSPPKIVFASNLLDCQVACLMSTQCRTTSFYPSINKCELFNDIPGHYGILLGETGVITMIAIDERQTYPRSIFNWIFNGDGESGACQSTSEHIYPTGWNYNGLSTQTSYLFARVNNYNDPGPSDRGNCYFYGGQASFSSMWQTINMTQTINPSLIDNQTVLFNFSAWIGGYQSQSDYAIVSLIFLNQINQSIGSNTTLGPVLPADRQHISSLLFRQTNGPVPIGARSFKVTVEMTRFAGADNDASVDNIAINFYE